MGMVGNVEVSTFNYEYVHQYSPVGRFGLWKLMIGNEIHTLSGTWGKVRILAAKMAREQNATRVDLIP